MAVHDEGFPVACKYSCEPIGRTSVICALCKGLGYVKRSLSFSFGLLVSALCFFLWLKL